MDNESRVERFRNVVFTKFVGLEYNASKIYKLDNKPISFRKNQRFKEILSKCQLHASSFRELNDISECSYVFDSNNRAINVDEVFDEKSKNLICSFSYSGNDEYNKYAKHRYENEISRILLDDDENYEQDLMWAHYANSHCGAKIDFSIDIDRLKNTNRLDSVRVFKVDYKVDRDDDRIIYNGNNLYEIMTTKKSCWKYENEYRAIIKINQDDFERIKTNKSLVCQKLPIIIKKITLGKKFSNNFVGRRDNDSEEYEPHIRDIAEKIIEVYEKANPHYPRPMIVGYKSRYSNVCDKDILDKNYNNINIR